MDIEKLITLADEISHELNWINNTMEPEEYEPWFKENLEQAYEYLTEVKDLIA